MSENLKSALLYSKSIERFIRVSGLLFFLFGLLAVILRITQFTILGDPPLEEIVLTREFLALQGIPSLLAGVFFLLGTTACTCGKLIAPTHWGRSSSSWRLQP